MSNLNSFHPFRQSIDTHQTKDSTNSQNSTDESNKLEKDEYKEPRISWKTKIKFMIIILALSVIYLIFTSISHYISPLLKPFGQHETDSEIENYDDDKTLLTAEFDESNKESRDVKSARGGIGIFNSIFCKGGKKSTFCNY